MKIVKLTQFKRVLTDVSAMLPSLGPGGGGGGTPLHKPYRYVPPQSVVCLHRFGLKTDVECAHFGLESGMGTRVNSKWILRNLFI